MSNPSALIKLFTRHRVAANLLMGTMILLGMLALLRLNVQVMPSFTTPVVSVQLVWPGASAEDIQNSITNPLEQELRNLDYLKEMVAHTQTNQVSLFLTFYLGADMSEAQEQVRERIDRIRHFPDDMEEPIIIKVEPYETIAKLLITGPDNLDELRPIAYQFERELLDLGVEKISILGLPKKEIAIQVPINNLNDIGLSLPQIVQLITEYSQDVPAGHFGKQETAHHLRSLEQRRSADDFLDLPLISEQQGRYLTLGDIATVDERSQEEQAVLFHHDKPAVELRLQRLDTTNSLTSARLIHKWFDEAKVQFGESLQLQLYDERWTIIKERIFLLLKNGLGGLILIVLILFLFLNRMVAWWVLVGIPTSFFAALAALYFFGGTINMVSLFAFIMALGIIVDDTIVVGEQAATNLRSQPPLSAVENAAQRMLMPITASSLTTICAFFPLFFISEVIGHIIFTIPLVIVCVIIASLIECFFVLPGHLHQSFQGRLQRAKKPSQFRRHMQLRLETFKRRYFRQWIEMALQHRPLVLTSILAAFLLSLTLVISGYIHFTFFPSPEGKHLQGSVRFTIGTPLEDRETFLRDVEQALRLTNDALKAKNDIVVTGVKILNQAQRNDYEVKHGENFASFYLELISPDQRKITNYEFIQHWREQINLPSYVENFSIEEPQLGPPGEDINIQLTGADIYSLKAAAEALKIQLARTNGVSGIEDNLPFGQEQLIFSLTPTAEAIGMTTAEMGRQLRAAFAGEIAQIFYDDNEEIEVRVSLPDAEQDQLDILEQFPIITPQGEVVPLYTLASFTYRPAPHVILTVDTKLSVNVTANINAAETNANQILQQLTLTTLPELQAVYHIDYVLRGRAEEQSMTLIDMSYGLLLGLILIYIILAWVFNSYVWPLLIMLTIPLGLTGAIFGHLLLGLDLTIMSLFGLFGLAGIVINDSIILLTEYRRLKSEGLNINEAVIKACMLRFRAVFLTSITTIAGLTPLLFERSLQAQFLIPMAVSITFGLAFATILILVFIPTLLASYEHWREKTVLNPKSSS